jgi:cytoskeleton protein RodZ
MVTAAKTPAAPALAGLLQFRTSEVAWVEVHDANGSLLLSRELRAGEAVGVNGATPLKVTIGNVKATQVAFRGKAMDLRSFTRDNIARIELQ